MEARRPKHHNSRNLLPLFLSRLFLANRIPVKPILGSSQDRYLDQRINTCTGPNRGRLKSGVIKKR